MKFNKSEQAILDKMKRDRSTTVGLDTGVENGRSFGRRKANAIASLQKKGVLEFIQGSQSQCDLYSKNGWGVNGRVWTSSYRRIQ